MSNPAGEELIGTCYVCGGEIRATIDYDRGSVSVIRAARSAAERHLRTHSAAEHARAELRHQLPRLSAVQRIARTRDVYRDLKNQWGDHDSRGVYSIDEVLGSPAMYRLWHAAGSCGAPHCQHQPALVSSR